MKRTEILYGKEILDTFFYTVGGGKVYIFVHSRLHYLLEISI